MKASWDWSLGVCSGTEQTRLDFSDSVLYQVLYRV
jgi:hypothetical protein